MISKIYENFENLSTLLFRAIEDTVSFSVSLITLFGLLGNTRVYTHLVFKD